MIQFLGAMKALVTGAAGFIGSHLTDELLKRGWKVLAVDIADDVPNLKHIRNNDFEYRTVDVSVTDIVTEQMKGCDMVFHLAANSDTREGSVRPEIDINKTLFTTLSVLEAMRRSGVKRLFFSSSSAVYGDVGNIAVKEDFDGHPISYYGAAKLSSESLISSYAYMNSIDSLVFRFPNVVGPRLTHGVIFDFINKLKENDKELEVLGDGKQSKQYVHVYDLVNAIVDFSVDMGAGMEIYNVSTDSFATVNEIADMTCARLGLKNVKYNYTGGSCGWKGDVSTFTLDASKAKAKGWKFNYDSKGSIKKTLDEMVI